MKIADIISPERIACNVTCSSKKGVLEKLGELLVTNHPGLISAEVFNSLFNRERLGSTGIGHGVAIPHGRLSKIQNALGAFIHLQESIDFDAIDDQPVDLLFALLVPEESSEEHLQLLAQLAEMFADKDFCDKLRHSNKPEAIFELFANR
jgi:PTS system nitrogen regulatory IIA component